MTAQNVNISTPSVAAGFKERAKRELKEFTIIAAYLAVLFCAISAYTSLLLGKYGESNTLTYSFAIINAMVIAKVILTGDMFRLGRRVESRPLYQSALLKAVLFFVLVVIFHFLEDFIKAFFRGKPLGSVIDEMEVEQVIARSIIIFCAFVPLFLFRELRRVLGEEKLYSLFCSRGVADKTH